MKQNEEVENKLRTEYSTLLPQLIRIQGLLDAKIRWHLKSIVYNLQSHH